MKKKKILIVVLAAVLLAAAAAGIVNTYNNGVVRLTEYEVADEKIPQGFDGYKIMVITDLHNAPFEEQITEYIQRNEPDITVFVGDMVQLPDSDLSETLQIVDNNSGLTEFYAVTGNHEMQNKYMWKIVEALEEHGVCMVESRDVTLEKDGDKVNLAGLADPQSDVLDEDEIETIQDVLEEIMEDDQDRYNILLNHRANLYPYIKDSGADLILSGHLHGGIIRLPFIGGLIGEEYEGYLPDYEYGYYKEGGSAAMIVSAGCDKNPKKMRIFNQPEVLLVTLKTK